MYHYAPTYILEPHRNESATSGKSEYKIPSSENSMAMKKDHEGTKSKHNPNKRRKIRYS